MRNICILGLLVACACGQPKPARLTPEELKTIKKNRTAISALQAQYQAAFRSDAAPFLEEIDAILTKRCAQAKIPREGCQVDTESGEVSRKPDQARK